LKIKLTRVRPPNKGKHCTGTSRTGKAGSHLAGGSQERDGRGSSRPVFRREIGKKSGKQKQKNISLDSDSPLAWKGAG